MDEHNFLPWHHQVFAAIKGSRLQHHLDPTQTPLKFLSHEDQLQDRYSPEYEVRGEQDTILVSWLLSAMAKKILKRMVGCDSAAQIWETLHVYYSALNRANIGKYKTQLRNSKMQGSLSDFLLKIKSLVDLLASIGHSMSAQDHIEAIFNGLSSDYNVFITSVNTRLDAYTVAEIEALLMAQEVRLEKDSTYLDITKPEANLVHTKPFTGGRGTFSSPRYPSSMPSSYDLHRR